MFKRIQIDRFRSCENVVLDDLGSMTALVGRNGVGKTNVLKAIEWLCQGSTLTAFGGTDAHEERCVTCEIARGEDVYRYSLRAGLIFRGGANSPEWLLEESLSHCVNGGEFENVFSRTGESLRYGRTGESVQVGATVPAMPALQAILPSGASVLRDIGNVTSFLRACRYHSFSESPQETELGVVFEEDYKTWLAHHQSTGKPGNSAFLKLLHMNQEEPALWDELSSLIGSNGLGLVDKIEVGISSLGTNGRKGSRIYWFQFKPNADSDASFGFDGLSLGTRRALYLLTAVLFDNSTVMLIEHPEDGVHRGLLRKLVDLLRVYADPCQFILTSHSPVVFDALSPAQTRLVSMTGGKTSVRGLSPMERDAASHYLQEEGAMSDFLETVQDER